MNRFNGKKFTVNKVFIDSNIWIYAFITLDDQTKRNTCIQLLENLYQEQIIIVSTQVIMEVHWNLIKKYGIRDEDAKLKIEAGILEIAKLSVTSKSTYDYAFNLRQQQNISF